MRGQVLGVDINSGEGQISGEDGRRYRFKPDDWGDRVGPAVGAVVDFEVADTRALSIYHVPGSTPVQALAVPGASGIRGEKNKYLAALLAIVVGIFGIHRFYLGRNGSAVIMLILTLTFFGMIVSGTWAFVDFLRYLLMSDEEFDRRYNQ